MSGSDDSGNAAPEREPVLPQDSLTATERVIPTWTDPVAAKASTPLGGPLGRHAIIGRKGFFTPLRALLLFAVVFLAFGWFFKAACIQSVQTPDGSALDWRGEWQYVAMCYSDIVPLFEAERLDEGAFPYRDSWVENAQGNAVAGERATEGERRYMEYPVLAGMFQWANAKLTEAWRGVPWLPDGLPVVIYFSSTAFWLALAWLVTLWATTMLSRRRPWDVALLALSPLVIVHAFTNFDLLVTAFTAAAMLAWARQRPTLAGVLLGLGAAVKLYPLLLLIPLLALCLRAGRGAYWWRTTWTAGAALAAVNLPFAVLYTDGWLEHFRRYITRIADRDSVYHVLDYFTGWNGFDPAGALPTTLNVVSLVALLACCAGVGWLALSAPRRPRFAQLAFLLVAAFLLTSKLWSPQYSLWLVPLAVLAVPRVKLLLGWMAVEAVLWAPRMYFYLSQANQAADVPDRGLPEGWFLGAVVLRDLLVLALCVVVLREIYRPAHDLVRVAGDDDPHGGVLDHAPDVHILPGPRTALRGWQASRGSAAQNR